MEEHLKGVIYKLTSPNNKIYIGQTINFEQRRKKYKYGAFKGQIKLWNNCKKHSWNPSDTIEIIELCEINDLDEREKYWINEYNSFVNGLNLDIGGKGRRGFKHSDETKEKIKKASSGRKHSNETKNKISESTKGNKKNENRKTLKGRKLTNEHKEKIKITKKNNPFKMTDEHRMKISMSSIGNKKRLGKKHNDETKNKISESKKGIPNYSRDVKIICLTTSCIYESQRDAAKKLKLNKASILRVCSNIRKSHKGLVFMYYEEWLKQNKL